MYAVSMDVVLTLCNILILSFHGHHLILLKTKAIKLQLFIVKHGIENIVLIFKLKKHLCYF